MSMYDRDWYRDHHRQLAQEARPPGRVRGATGPNWWEVAGLVAFLAAVVVITVLGAQW